MTWLTLALLAPISWAMVNILDKVLVEEFIRDARTIVIIEGFFALLIAMGIWLSGPITAPPALQIVGLLAAGFLYYASTILYYRAMMKSDPAVVSVFLQTMPIFTVLWGILFFAELYSGIVYVGVGLLITGSVIASLKGGQGFTVDATARSVGLRLILPALLLVSVNYALQKWSLAYTDARSIFFFTRLGGLIFSLILISSPSIRAGFVRTVTPHLGRDRLSTWGIFLLMECFNLAGVFFILMAFAQGPISLVSAASGVQPIFVGLFSIGAGLLIGRGVRAYGEGVTWRLVISTVVIVAGIYLISLAQV